MISETEALELAAQALEEACKRSPKLTPEVLKSYAHMSGGFPYGDHDLTDTLNCFALLIEARTFSLVRKRFEATLKKELRAFLTPPLSLMQRLRRMMR